jgi:hypothetical protein
MYLSLTFSAAMKNRHPYLAPDPDRPSVAWLVFDFGQTIYGAILMAGGANAPEWVRVTNPSATGKPPA